MRHISILTIIMFLAACSPKKELTDPQTLDEYKTALAEKKKEMATLQSEIEKLSDKVAELDPSLQESSKLVEVGVMQAADFVRYINIQGSVEAEDPINAVSEVPGRLLTMNAKEGNYIKKGNLIATMETEAIQKQIDELNTSLSLAKDVYDRQARLWSQNIGSEIQYLQAKNNVERIEKSLETVKYQLTKTKVFSPASGVVDMVITKQGEVVAPGAPIIQILNTSNLKITTALPETYLRNVKKGQNVTLGFPSIDQEVTGRVVRLGTKINPANRTLELEIRPLKKPSLLKPNMLAEIKLKEISFDDVIMMPLEYVQQEVDGKEFVYVIIQDEEGKQRAEKKYVTLGEAAEGKVIIKEGIAAGDMVILKGARSISNGELVEYSK